MKKSRTLTADERRTIGGYAVNHPEESDRSVAEFFGCTQAQVRYAVELIDAGKICVRRTRLTDEGRAKVAMATTDITEMFHEELHRAMAELRADNDMRPDKRIALLAQMARMKRTLQETAIEAHIKRPDASFLSALVRRYAPAATDEDVILILNETYEIWKASTSQV